VYENVQGVLLSTGPKVDRFTVAAKAEDPIETTPIKNAQSCARMAVIFSPDMLCSTLNAQTLSNNMDGRKGKQEKNQKNMAIGLTRLGFPI
jgi:hypothetical protein